MCSRPARAGVDGVGGLARRVLVAGAAADALVATGAERPAAVLRRRPVAGQQHDADVGGHAGVVEGAVQLVDGVRAERVAHLGPVERDPHGRLRPVDDVAVIGDVGQIGEFGDRLPQIRLERVLGVHPVDSRRSRPRSDRHHGDLRGESD